MGGKLNKPNHWPLELWERRKGSNKDVMTLQIFKSYTFILNTMTLSSWTNKSFPQGKLWATYPQWIQQCMRPFSWFSSSCLSLPCEYLSEFKAVHLIKYLFARESSMGGLPSGWNYEHQASIHCFESSEIKFDTLLSFL